MSHLVTGIDVGSYSIKFVVIDAGFRRSHVVDVFEELVPPGDGPVEQRQMEALRRGRERIKRESLFFSVLPGDKTAIRLLDLPFVDPRKVDQVVPYELEAQIVWPLEEVVFDHQILKKPVGQASVIAVAAKTDDVGSFLGRMTEARIALRGLHVASLVYRTVEPDTDLQLDIGRQDEEGAEEPLVDEPVTAVDAVERLTLLVDVGHQRTNLVILRAGTPVYARTLMRGGRHLTAAVAHAFAVDLDQAEEIKRTRGTVAHAGFLSPDPGEQRLAEVLRDALSPLIRDVRQTLASLRARVHVPLGGLSVVGGSAALPGLAAALAEELETTIEPFAPERGSGADESMVETPDVRFALAEALAWSGTRGTPQIDLRRGPFVYRASYSVVRQRAWRLAALGLMVLLAAGLDGTMALGRAEKQNDRLKKELEDATRELFGAPDTNAEKVSRLMKQGFREELPPIPEVTSFDLLNEISRRMPSKEDIKMNLLELDVRPKKTFLKGLIDSVASVDKVAEQLKDIDCFEEIQKGAITEVSGGEKQFTLTIKTTCP